MEKPVVIIGAGGPGRAVNDIFQSNQVLVYGFLDPDESLEKTEVDDIAVIGNSEDADLLDKLSRECEFFVALEEQSIRQNLVEDLKEKYKVIPVNAIHETSYISTSSQMGHGNLISAGVFMGAGSEIGSNNLLHPGALLNHEVNVGDLVQVGAGSVINSGVTVEDGVFIGSGVTIVSGVTLGKGARIGAGSVVIESVRENDTVFGNPAASVS